MLRKCERLARTASPHRPPGKLLTLYAPPDFRVREMEKWLKHQSAGGQTTGENYSCCSKCGPLGASGVVTTQGKHLRRRSSVIATRTHASDESPALSRSNSSQSTLPPKRSSITRVSSTRSASVPRKPAVIPDRVPKRPSTTSTQTLVDHQPPIDTRYYLAKHGLKHQISRVAKADGYKASIAITVVPSVIRQADYPKMIPPPAIERDKMTHGRSQSAHASRIEDGMRTMMQSPDPLPIPYRTARRRREEHDSDHEADSAHSTSSEPAMTPRDLLDEPMNSKIPSPQSTLVDMPSPESGHAHGHSSPRREPSPTGAPTAGTHLETITEKSNEHEDVAARHPLLHRRSSLKKKDSMHSLASQAKSVTWAMDRDWTEHASKFIKVTNEAEVAGECRHFFMPLRPSRTLCGVRRHEIFHISFLMLILTNL